MHPVPVILFDSSLNGALEPSLVFVWLAAIKLIVDLKGKVCKERGLRSTEIVGSVAIENLVVIFDFENTVLDNTLGQVDPTIYQETEGHKVL